MRNVLTVRRAAEWLRDRSRLVLLLAAALVIFSTGISWGLPQAINEETVQPWALDTIAPIAPLNEAYYRFTRSGNDYVVYPLFHYMVLSAAYAPYVGWQLLSGAIESPASGYPYGVSNVAGFTQDLTLLARVVSLFMALGIVLVIFDIVRIAVDERAAYWAALSCLLIAPLGFYAKTSNLDVPYAFWTCLALWRAVHILRGPATRDFVLLGIFAALAVATKDQAYGFFLLVPFLLAVRLSWDRENRRIRASDCFLSLFERRMLYGGAAAVVTYALANNLFFGGWDGWIRHMSYGGELYDYRSSTEANFYSPLAQAGLLWRSTLLTFEALGPVGVSLSLYGSWVAIKSRNLALILLLLCAVTYYVAVVAVFNLVFSRYLLVCFILATPFVGLAIARLLQTTGPLRPAAIGLVVVSFLCQLVLVANLALTLTRDSREAMGDWISGNVPEGSVIESQVRQRMLPHIPEGITVSVAGNSGDPITMLSIPEELTPAALASRDPDYVLILEGLGVTGDPAVWTEPSMRAYYAALLDGSLDYVPVATFATPHFLPFGQIPGTRPTSILLKKVAAD